MAEEPIKCSSTGKNHGSVPKPTFVVVSVSFTILCQPRSTTHFNGALKGIQYALFPIIRASKPSPLIFVWQSAAASGGAQLLLPPHLGGIPDDLVTAFTPEERKHGLPFSITGSVINTPGLPPMYDWELHPANTDFFQVKTGVFFEISNYNMRLVFLSCFPRRLADLVCSRATVECDGLLTDSALAYDGEETLASINAWATELNKPVHNIGPLRPFTPGTTDFSKATLAAEIDTAPPGVGAKVKSFLDEKLSTLGECSVVYICLGSMFWSAHGELKSLIVDIC